MCITIGDVRILIGFTNVKEIWSESSYTLLADECHNRSERVSKNEIHENDKSIADRF